MDVGEFLGSGTVIPFHHGRLAGSVVEEMEGVIAVGEVGDLLAVEGIVGGASGGGDLPDPEAAGVVFVGNGFGSLAHGLQLTALLPGVQPFPIAGGVADLIVGDVAAVEFRQFVFPVIIGVGIGDGFQGGSRQGTHGVGIPLLVQNVAAAIILVRPGGAILTGSQIVLVVDPDQLAQGIVGIGSELAILGNGADITHVIVGVGEVFGVISALLCKFISCSKYKAKHSISLGVAMPTR